LDNSLSPFDHSSGDDNGLKLCSSTCYREAGDGYRDTFSTYAFFSCDGERLLLRVRFWLIDFASSFNLCERLNGFISGIVVNHDEVALDFCKGSLGIVYTDSIDQEVRCER